MNKKLYCSALSALLGGILLTSCTNDLNELNGNKGPQTMPGSYVYTPDVVAWSGSQILGNTFTTRAEESSADVDLNYTVNNALNTRAGEDVFVISDASAKWDLKLHHEYYDEDVTIAQFMNGIGDENQGFLPNNKNNKEKLICEFLVKGKAGDEYEFFPISASTNQKHTLGVFYYEGDQRIDVEVWSDKEDNVSSDLKGFKLKLKRNCNFGFYISGKTSTSGDTTYYSLQELNDPQLMYQTQDVYETQHAGVLKQEDLKNFTYWGSPIDLSGNTFISLEDWVDFDFNDFFLYVPGKTITTTTGDDRNPDDEYEPGETPTPPGGDETVCDKCGHDHNGPSTDCPDCIEDGHQAEGYPGTCKPADPNVCDNCGHNHNGPSKDCPDCKDGQPADGYHGSCWEDPSTPNTPNQPGKPKPTGNEVEINFALNDIHTNNDGSYKYDIADLVSKLSIHVRYPHDVEVIIPVPEYLYCDLDDFLIMQNHDDFVYGGSMTENKRTYVVEDKATNKYWEVSLGVQFVGEGADQLTTEGKGYIRVYTSGINEELIDYLQKTNGDGINFEVYNYYNRGNMEIGNFPEIDYEELQYKYLSHSFVNFDWNESGEKVLPDNYINAFNTVAGMPNPGDCYMWIIGDDHALLDNVYKKDGATISRIDNGSYNITWSNNERSKYGDPYQGPHFNNGDLNWIYTLKTIDETNYTDMPKDGNWPFKDTTSWWQSVRFGGNNDFKCSGLINWHK